MSTNITYGVYLAVAQIVLTLIGHFAGTDTSASGKWFGLLGFIPTIAILVLGIKARKEEDFGGVITYGQCVGTGTLIALFSGIISAIYLYVHFSYIAPEAVDFIRQQQAVAMAAQMKGQPQASIDQAAKMASMFTSPLFMALWTLIMAPLFGLIIALIAGIFLKTKEEDMPQMA